MTVKMIFSEKTRRVTPSPMPKSGEDKINFEVPSGWYFKKAYLDKIQPTRDGNAKIAAKPAHGATGPCRIKVHWHHGPRGFVNYKIRVYASDGVVTPPRQKILDKQTTRLAPIPHPESGTDLYDITVPSGMFYEKAIIENIDPTTADGFAIIVKQPKVNDTGTGQIQVLYSHAPFGFINYRIRAYAVNKEIREIESEPEVKYKMIAITTLGMNRWTQQDTDHPFDIEQYLTGHKIFYTSSVNFPYTFPLPIMVEEKRRSTPFYEVAKVCHNLSTEFSISPGHVSLIFGRGTIGPMTELQIRNELLQRVNAYGKDSFKVIVAKSFGVGDTLMALHPLTEDLIGKINLLILIDGYVNPTSRDELIKDNKYIIPDYVERAFCIYQTVDDLGGSLNGTRAHRGNRSSDEISNFRVSQAHIDSYGPPRPRYNHYSDGASRVLDLTDDLAHFNMEEIVSVIPCFDQDDALRTLPDIIRIFASRKYDVPLYLWGRGSAHKPSHYYAKTGNYAIGESD